MDAQPEYKPANQATALDKPISWLFTSERTDLQARATKHFGRALGQEWSAEELGQFEWSIKQDMTIDQYLRTAWWSFFNKEGGIA